MVSFEIFFKIQIFFKLLKKEPILLSVDAIISANLPTPIRVGKMLASSRSAHQLNRLPCGNAGSLQQREASGRKESRQAWHVKGYGLHDMGTYV